MATHITIRLEVRYAWWLMPYVYTLAFFCALFAAEPNQEKLNRILNRAVTVRAVREKQGAYGG